MLLIPALMATACGDDSAAIDDDSASSGASSSETAENDTSDSETSDPDTTDGSTSPAQCGDGRIDAGEDCDGEALGDGRCDTLGFATGTLGCNADCTYDVSACSDGTCGDGSIDPGEECDGEELVGQGCEDVGFDEGVLSCSDDCTLDTQGCVLHSCGNGVIDDLEACDGALLGGADCVSEGFLGGDLACSEDCSAHDTSACFFSICGDGITMGVEFCDGADLAGADCVSAGLGGGVLACADDCTFDTTACYSCGDGVVDPTEDCEGDVGAATCGEVGFDGGELGCGGDCRYDTSACFVCGDGELGGAEICDGNDFGANTCVALGFDGGAPRCADDCGSFTTESCHGVHTFCAAPDAAIGPDAGTVTQSDIAVAGLVGAVVDVDIVVDAPHTAVGNLVLDVAHLDSATGATLVALQCGAGADIDAVFDQDAGAAPICGAPVAIAGDVLPLADLDAMGATVGDGNGTWRLSVLDTVPDDGGALAQWCVALTTESTAERFAYVANDGFPNSVTGYAIADDGALTELPGSPYPTGGDGGLGVAPNAMVRCGEFIYVANSNSGSISGFVAEAGGDLQPLGDSPFLVDFSPASLACDAGFLYATNAGEAVARFEIGTDGSLAALGSVASAYSALGVTLDPVADRLFVANLPAQLSVYDIDAGELSEVPGSPFDTSGNHPSAAVSPDGSLVALEGVESVHLFAVEDDGSVTEVPGSPFADPVTCQGVGLAWAPDGSRLFVGHNICFPVASLVMVYDVVDGGLEPVAGAPFDTGGSSGATGLAVDEGGDRLFVSDFAPETAVLQVAPNGTLTPIAGSPFVNSHTGNHPTILLR